MIKVLVKVRTLFDLVSGYVRKHYFFFVLGLTMGMLAVFLGKDTQPENKEVIGIVGNYTVATLPLSIQEKLSFGLTRLTTGGEATSSASIAFTASDSGRILKFQLSSDLYWHDKTPFTAENVNYNLKGVTINKGDQTVSFTLKEPFAPLPVLLTQPLFKTGLIKSYPFFPDSINRLLFSSGLVGLGEYKLSSIEFFGRFISNLEIKNVQDQTVIKYKFYPSQVAALTALQLGQVERLTGILSKELSHNPYYSVQANTQTYTQAMLFYNVEQGFLADKNFRQGLTYGLPDVFSQGVRADSPFPPHSWARSVLVKKYPQNLLLAKELLSKFATGSAEKIRLKLTSSPALQASAQEIQLNWQKLGIETEIETVELLPSRYQIYLGLVEIPPDPDQYFLWHSTQPTNISRYKSFKVDKLLEEGRRTLDRKERQQKYSDFQKAITEDVPAAFLFYPTVYDIKRKY